MATITSLKFDIDSSWNSSGVTAARGDLKLLNEEIRRIQNARVKLEVNADTAKAMSQLEALQRASDNMVADIDVDVDTAKAEAQLAILARDRTVNIDADGNLVSELARISDGFDRAGNQSIKFGGQASLAMRWAKLGALAFIASLVVMPGLITTIGGLLTTGLAGAFIAVGAIAVSKNEEIVASFNRLKEGGIEVVKRSAAGMIPPIVAGLNDILFHVRELEPAFTQAFTSAGQAIGPLIDGLMHMVENAMPGINVALANIGPVVNGLQQGMENFGSEMGRMFAGMSVGAQGLGQALNVTFTQVGTLMANFGVAAGAMADQGTRMWDGFLTGLNSVVAGYLDGLTKMVTQNGTVYADFMRTFGEGIGTLLRDLLPVIGELAATFMEHLLPVLRELIPPLSNFIAQMMTGFRPVIEAVMPIVVAFATGLGQILEWLGPLAPIIGTVVAAIKVWTIAQALLNIALTANPIGVIIVAIAALASGIVYLATKTQFFQELWEKVRMAASAVWQFLQQRWDQFIQFFVDRWQQFSTTFMGVWNAVWNAVKVAAEVVWNAIKAAWDVFTGMLKAAWEAFSAPFKMAWEALWFAIRATAATVWAIIEGLWQAFGDNIRAIWDRVSAIFRASWEALWNLIKDVASNIWNWLKDRWNEFTTAVRAVYDFFANALRAAWEAFWNLIKSAAQFIWDNIRNNWQILVNAVREVYDAFSLALRTAWEALWNTVKDVAQGIWDKITTAWDSFTGFLRTSFETVRDKIRDIWDGIKGIFAKPINFIIRIWNEHVAGKFGLQAFDEIKDENGNAYAGGGRVAGPGTSISDSIPARLSDGEHVWTAREVNAAGGHSAVERMRQDALMGRGYAAGGVVEWIQGQVSQMEPALQLTSGVRNTADYHGQGKAGDFSNGGIDGSPEMRSLAGKWADKWGANTLELIHNPFDRNIKDGRSVGDGYGFYGANTMADHRDHVHIAVDHPLDNSEGGSGLIGGIINRVRETLGALFARLTNPLLSAIPDQALGMNSELGRFPKQAATKLRDGLRNIIDGSDDGSYGGGPGMGGALPEGDRLRLINEAMSLTRTPPPNTAEAWQRGLNTLIERESSWNPNAINDWDINAQQGYPTKGLMQMRDDTFMAHAVPGHTNIWDALDNISSGINYIRAEYGDISNVQQANAGATPMGYMAGTNNAQAGWHLVGEAGPEMVNFRGGEQVRTFSDLVGELKTASTAEGREVSTKLSTEMKTAVDRLVAKQIQVNEDLKKAFTDEVKELATKLVETGQLNQQDLVSSLADIVERMIASSTGINLNLPDTMGADPHQYALAVAKDVLPQLEMMLKQRVGLKA